MDSENEKILMELKNTLETASQKYRFDLNNPGNVEMLKEKIIEHLTSDKWPEHVKYDAGEDVFILINGVDEKELLCFLPYKYNMIIKVGDTIKVRFGDSDQIWFCKYVGEPSDDSTKNIIDCGFKCELKAPNEIKTITVDIYAKKEGEE